VTPFWTLCLQADTLKWFTPVTDECGFALSQSVQIPVSLAPAAVFINPPGDINISCNEYQSFQPSYLAYTNASAGRSIASCEISGEVLGEISGEYSACGGSVVQIWTFTDECGRTITHTQNITLYDNEAPVISELDDIILPGCNTAWPAAPTTSWSDNCSAGGIITGVAGSVMTEGCYQNIDYTFNIMDDCENAAIEVIVRVTRLYDYEPPVWNQPLPATEITLECGETVPPLILTALDNCGDVTYEQLSATMTGDCPVKEMIARSVTATDDCGNSITFSQTITIQDLTPPIWNQTMPVDITVDCGDVPLIPTGLTATDACDGLVTVNIADDGEFNLCGYVITRTFTASDACLNTVTYIQTIIVNPAPAPTLSVPTLPDNLTCAEADAFNVGVASYTNGGAVSCLISGEIVAEVTHNWNQCSGGTITVTYSGTVQCSYTLYYSKTINVAPAAVPILILPYIAFTEVTCSSAETLMLSLQIPDNLSQLKATYLNWETGGCEISGEIIPTVQQAWTVCAGGSIILNWYGTDACGNVLTDTYVINVLPATEPTFVYPPVVDETVTCYTTETFAQFIAEDPDYLAMFNGSYSNQETGGCTISGVIIPTITQNWNACEGGTIVFVWDVTTECGYTNSKTVTLTVLPAVAPTFTVPNVEEVTMTCYQAGLVAQNLESPEFLTTLRGSYSNGETGGCAISGDIIPTITQNWNACEGGTIVFVWDVTTECGYSYSKTVTITVTPTTEPTFYPYELGDEMTCNQAEYFATAILEIPGFLSGNPYIVTYSNGEAGDCLISGEIIPTVQENWTVCAGGTITLSWNTITECGYEYSASHVINVLPAVAPTFTVPEAEDVTVPCYVAEEFAQLSANPEFLSMYNGSYTNGESGGCEISGDIIPTITQNWNACDGGSIVFVWDVTTECGYTYSKTVTITVTPAVDPVLTIPVLDIPAQSCSEAGLFMETLNNPESLAMLKGTYTNGQIGGCLISGEITPTIEGSWTTCDGGGITLSWNIIDECGNEHTASYVINVLSAPTPTLSLPEFPAQLTCDAAQNFLTAPDATYTNGESGDCLITGTIEASITHNWTLCEGGYLTVSYDGNDACGIHFEESRIIYVDAALTPEFIDPPEDITLSCDQYQFFEPSYLAYSNTSAKSMAVVSNSDAGIMAVASCEISGEVLGEISGEYDACGGIIYQTWTITDACGDPITHVQTITIYDETPPLLAGVPEDITVECDNIPEPAMVTVTDNCDSDVAVAFTEYNIVGDCAGNYTIRRIWTAADECGNEASAIQVITVEDTTPPVWDQELPATEITLECGEPIPPLILTATDNCGEVTYVLGSATMPGECPVKEMIARSVTASDDCENTITFSQIIYIEDHTPPYWNQTMPGDITVDCGNVPLIPTGLKATDACDGEVIVNVVDEGEFSLCGYVITRTFTARDECLNQIQHVQTITVNPAPMAQWVEAPENITITCTEAGTMQPSRLVYDNFATGECWITSGVLGEITGSYSACGGELLQTWTFTDECNRTINHQQIITVMPAPEPVLNIPNLGQFPETMSCSEANNWETILGGYLYAYYSNSESGDCLIFGEVGPTVSENWTLCEGGTLTFVWAATDECGYYMENTHVIDVLPATLPDLTVPTLPDNLSCAEAGAFLSGTIPDATYTNIYDEGNGNCLIGGSIAADVDEDWNLCNGGTITVTYSSTVQCGFTLYYTKIITVAPAAAPELSIPLGLPTVISCAEADVFMTPADATYTNGDVLGCEISGSIPAVVTPDWNLCAGGTITIKWEATVACGYLLAQTHTITVLTAPEPTLNLPTGLPRLLSCDQAAAFTTAPDATYTNGQTGACEISGFIPALLTPAWDLCEGGTIVVSYSGEDQCGFAMSDSWTITVEPAPGVTLTLPELPGSLSCYEAVDFTSAPAASYSNYREGACENSGTIPAVVTPQWNSCNGGYIVVSYNGFDDCGNPLVGSWTIVVRPAAPAVLALPEDLPTRLSCAEAAAYTSAPPATYSNGQTGECENSGIIQASLAPSWYMCSGGGIVISYVGEDDCGNLLESYYTITVDAAPVAILTLPTLPEFLSCEEASRYTTAPDATYSNGETGVCENSGSITPDLFPSWTLCEGGYIEVVYTGSDACGFEMTQTFEIPVSAAPQVAFIDPPGAIRIPCDEYEFFKPIYLSYSNAGAGSCLIDGKVLGIISGEYDVCGGSLIQTWTFTDECERTISYVQNITLFDDELPVIEELADFTLELCNEEWPESVTTTWSDNCSTGGTIVGVAGDVVTVGCTQYIDYTFNVSDLCGNPAVPTVTRVTRKYDVTPPVIRTTAVNGYLGCNPIVVAPVFTGLDNCEGIFTPNVATDGPTNTDGLYSQTWTATYTDACGNEAEEVSITYTWIGEIICYIDAYTIEPVFGQSLGTATVVVEVDGVVSNLLFEYLWSTGERTATATQIPTSGATVYVSYGSCTTDCAIPATQGCPDLFYDLGCNPALPNEARVIADLEAHFGVGAIITFTEGGFSAGPISKVGCLRSQVFTVSYQDQFGSALSGCTVTYTWTEDLVKPIIATTAISEDLGCNPEAIVPPVFTGFDNCEGLFSPAVATDGPVADEEGCGWSQTWKANFTDACLNKADEKVITYTWKVDKEKPSFEFPADITVCEEETVPTITAPIATDNCDLDVEVTWVRSDGITSAANGNLNAPFTDKITTITFTAEDDCNNATSNTMTVTINEPCSRIELLKTTNLVVDPTLNWTFVLYEGAFGDLTEISSVTTLGVADGILFRDAGPLSRYNTYTVCELGVPAGYGTTWMIDPEGDGTFMLIPYTTTPGAGGVYNPNSMDVPVEDFGNRCYEIPGSMLPANLYGETPLALKLKVNNTFPGGDARTPGYWKNWNTCTGGGQQYTATANADDQNGDGVITAFDRVMSGWALLDDIIELYGISWGDFELTTCEDAQKILDNRDLNGVNRASDPAYNLAKHLLAYQLNQGAGAYICYEMTAIEIEAVDLLISIGFNGTGDYLRKVTKPAETTLNNSGQAIYSTTWLAAGSYVISAEYYNASDVKVKETTLTQGNRNVSNITGLFLKAYPNPFADRVYFDLQWNRDSHALLEIFDIRGAKLTTLYDNLVEAGLLYRLEYAPVGVAPGMLLYRMVIDNQVINGKVLYQKQK
jgi:hypothetical protein